MRRIAAPDLTLFNLAVASVVPVALDPFARVGDRLASLAFGFRLEFFEFLADLVEPSGFGFFLLPIDEVVDALSERSELFGDTGFRGLSGALQVVLGVLEVFVHETAVRKARTDKTVVAAYRAGGAHAAGGAGTRGVRVIEMAAVW